MAKIQVDTLRNIGERYGALEADTGVPTVNLKEGVTLVHEVGRDLALTAGHYFTFSIAQVHSAAGTIDSAMTPTGVLNVLNQTNLGAAARWDPARQDCYLLGAGAVQVAVSGQSLGTALSIWDPSASAPGLSSATQAATNVILWAADTVAFSAPGGGGIPLVAGGSVVVVDQFPIRMGGQANGRLRFQSTVTGAGSMTIAFWIRAWLGGVGVRPPFA